MNDSIEQAGFHDEFTGAQRRQIILPVAPPWRDAGIGETASEIIGHGLADKALGINADRRAGRARVDDQMIFGAIPKPDVEPTHSMNSGAGSGMPSAVSESATPPLSDP